MLTVRLATADDAVDLAKRLREADLKEIHAIGETEVAHSLLRGVQSPDPCYVAVDANDNPHVIFGTVPSPDPLIGFVWMMASDEISTHWIQLLRETKPWINTLSKHYEILANAVHADNQVHIKWLRWAGFSLLRKFELNGSLFYEFARLNTQEV